MPERTEKTQSRDDHLYDCIIVGGGPAGLSAALYLGRLRRSVLVIDDQEGRSTWHQVNRNYLGFPEGVHATALRELGETQASQYGVEFLRECASDIRMEGEGQSRRFYVATRSGTRMARSIILATGVTDHFPQFEESEACIGKSMFWCIICDGYESIGKRVVVLGHNEHAASLALQLLVFTDDIVLVSGEQPFDLDEQKKATLREHGIAVRESNCHVYTCGTPGQLSAIQLEDGTEIELDMLFVVQHMQPNNQLAKQLKIATGDSGFIIASPEQLTNIEGLYAAGDVTRLHNHQVTSAVHEGGMAAAAANYYLYESWQKE